VWRDANDANGAMGEVAAEVSDTTQSTMGHSRPLLRRSGDLGRSDRPRVAVWGHYYGPNLGDELVTSTVIQAIQSRRPDAQVCAISLNPADTLHRHGVPSYPLNRSSVPSTRGKGWRRYPAALLRRIRSAAREIPHVWASYRLMQSVDLLVVAGSGQLLDQWSGPWGHPYAIFKWSLLARLTGTRVAILSAGAGPLRGRLARYLIRSAVEHADYVSLRDEGSIDVLRAAGITRELPVCPDMGFGLPVGRSATASSGIDDAPADGPGGEPPGARVVVGLNAMAHAHPGYWGRGDLSRYEAYRDKLTTVIRGLVENGVTVRLFSSHAVADAVIADDLVSAAWASDPALAGRLDRRRLTEVGDLVEFIRECDVVIGARYHSVVLPMLMGVPTIGVAYHPKTVGVMQMAGQSAYCFPDIDTFEADELLERTRALIAHRADVRTSLSANIPELCEAVERQFDEVFSIASEERGTSAPPRRAPQTERGRHVA